VRRLILGLAEVHLVVVVVNFELFPEGGNFMTQFFVLAHKVHFLRVDLHINHHAFELNSATAFSLQFLLQTSVLFQINRLPFFDAMGHRMFLEDCLFDSVGKLEGGHRLVEG
jgi:hypothetical protein